MKQNQFTVEFRTLDICEKNIIELYYYRIKKIALEKSLRDGCLGVYMEKVDLFMI